MFVCPPQRDSLASACAMSLMSISSISGSRKLTSFPKCVVNAVSAIVLDGLGVTGSGLEGGMLLLGVTGLGLDEGVFFLGIDVLSFFFDSLVVVVLVIGPLC